MLKGLFVVAVIVVLLRFMLRRRSAAACELEEAQAYEPAAEGFCCECGRRAVPGSTYCVVHSMAVAEVYVPVEGDADSAPHPAAPPAPVPDAVPVAVADQDDSAIALPAVEGEVVGHLCDDVPIPEEEPFFEEPDTHEPARLHVPAAAAVTSTPEPAPESALASFFDFPVEDSGRSSGRGSRRQKSEKWKSGRGGRGRWDQDDEYDIPVYEAVEHGRAGTPRSLRGRRQVDDDRFVDVGINSWPGDSRDESFV